MIMKALNSKQIPHQNSDPESLIIAKMAEERKESTKKRRTKKTQTNKTDSEGRKEDEGRGEQKRNKPAQKQNFECLPLTGGFSRNFKLALSASLCFPNSFFFSLASQSTACWNECSTDLCFGSLLCSLCLLPLPLRHCFIFRPGSLIVLVFSAISFPFFLFFSTRNADVWRSEGT